MQNLIFSLSAVLGKPVHSTKGVPVAVLTDLVCNKDTGRLTYFILSDGALPGADKTEPSIFAVHHSYFYFSTEGQHLIFSPRLGNEDQAFFLDLPPGYESIEVGTFMDFTAYLQQNAGVASHRSDDDRPR